MTDSGPGATPDPEGRLTSRFIANSADRVSVLHVAASHLPLPLGLAHAVAYWTQLLQLERAPEHEQTWDRWCAFAGWSERVGAPEELVAAAWVRVRDAVIELRLHGPAHERALLAQVWAAIHESFRCDAFGAPQPMRPSPEPWWSRAQALRAAGELDEALALVEREGDRAEALLVQAELHAERMRLALGATELEAARDAWRQAAACARAYAAGAASGGDGAARSIERDRILAALGPEPASDERHAGL